MFTRIQTCSAVTSAFAKSVSKVLKDQLKIEVLVKSAPAITDKRFEGVKGGFPVITRVFSNAQGKKKDFDNLLSLTCLSPLSDEGSSMCSYTAEYSVLPCLMDWTKKNISTKNIVVFNLTDGDTYATLGQQYFGFRNRNTAELKTKYLRGVPNMTLLIGREISQSEAKHIYGQDLILTRDSCFVNPMMRTLIKVIDGEMK